MIYKSETSEKGAAMQTAELMSVAARTAPKACGVDLIKTIVLDGEDKNRLTAEMREIGDRTNRPHFIRDADNVDECQCIVLIGTALLPRSLNCGLCGMEKCSLAAKAGIPCAMSIHDLGIAVGSAAATAMDHRIDNRVLYSAGTAALKLKLFSDVVRMCFGIGLATKGKNIFFDRQPIED
jgi:uncharacterized ferredoxin-like protein